ncbi:hypothetical protein Taro_006631 [Colocasia esculenta]|uniref:Uncharacterized protein n=1 Tax=Colocasia esculenta TaxID=4460 RepID=A0A843TP91_COLES|nr:hypothetical protein [Colocasia esculenta]
MQKGIGSPPEGIGNRSHQGKKLPAAAVLPAAWKGSSRGGEEGVWSSGRSFPPAAKAGRELGGFQCFFFPLKAKGIDAVLGRAGDPHEQQPPFSLIGAGNTSPPFSHTCI